MRGSYVRAVEPFETTNSNVDSGESEELYNGLVNDESESWHGISPLMVSAVITMITASMCFCSDTDR